MKFLKTAALVLAAALLIYMLLTLLLVWGIHQQPPADMQAEEPSPSPVRPAIESAEGTSPGHPDPLHIRRLSFGDAPAFSDMNSLSVYVLRNLLSGSSSFECYLSRSFAPDEATGHAVLSGACDNSMSYFLFGAYSMDDMFSSDCGDDRGMYAKARLNYINEYYDSLAKIRALEFIAGNPLPADGFADRQEEMDYALLIHDFLAKKIVYSGIGYDSDELSGARHYAAKQEAYNALADSENSAVCAGYARGFALIAQYAGIDCAWVWDNREGDRSHAWNVIYPCDGSEPVTVDVTWDDVCSSDVPGQAEVSRQYFYIPVSSDAEHMPDRGVQNFLDYLHGYSDTGPDKAA